MGVLMMQKNDLITIYKEVGIHFCFKKNNILSYRRVSITLTLNTLNEVSAILVFASL